MQRDSYRIIRVNFRRRHPAWWDSPAVVAVLLTGALIALGLAIVFAPAVG